MKQRNLTLVTMSVAMVIGLLSGNTSAEIYTLKFAMAVPPGHYTATQGAQFFMDRAKELSDGKIEFEWYPGEQLGKAKDMLSLVQTGVTDIADVVPSYVSDKLPLTSVAELPGQTETSCEGTRILYEITRPDAILGKEDYGNQKVTVLMSATLAPYKILTAHNAVNTLDDMKGLKIRSSGGASDNTIRSLGAVGVRLSGPEINEALARKTVDGAMYPYMSLKPFGIESIRYSVMGVSVGTLSTSFVMNTQKLNSLPEEIQQVLLQAGKEAGINYCEYMDNTETGQIESSTTIEAITLSDAEVKRWNTAMEVSKDKWVEDMTKRRKPAKEALQAWNNARLQMRLQNN